MIFKIVYNRKSEKFFFYVDGKRSSEEHFNFMKEYCNMRGMSYNSSLDWSSKTHRYSQFCYN